MSPLGWRVVGPPTPPSAGPASGIWTPHQWRTGSKTRKVPRDLGLSVFYYLYALGGGGPWAQGVKSRKKTLFWSRKTPTPGRIGVKSLFFRKKLLFSGGVASARQNSPSEPTFFSLQFERHFHKQFERRWSCTGKNFFFLQFMVHLPKQFERQWSCTGKTLKTAPPNLFWRVLFGTFPGGKGRI